MVVTVLGVVLSYAALTAGFPGLGANANVAQEFVCAPGDACSPIAAAEEPTTYATPVDVDCRAIVDSVGTADGPPTIGLGDLLFSGPCGPVISDFRYRVSRFPDSERSNGALGPQRVRRSTRIATTCTGVPRDHGGLVLASVPPIAMYASAPIPRPPRDPALIGFDSERTAPTRSLEPPERPPRA